MGLMEALQGYTPRSQGSMPKFTRLKIAKELGQWYYKDGDEVAVLGTSIEITPLYAQDTRVKYGTDGKPKCSSADGEVPNFNPPLSEVCGTRNIEKPWRVDITCPAAMEGDDKKKWCKPRVVLYCHEHGLNATVALDLAGSSNAYWVSEFIGLCRLLEGDLYQCRATVTVCDREMRGNIVKAAEFGPPVALEDRDAYKELYEEIKQAISGIPPF